MPLDNILRKAFDDAQPLFTTQSAPEMFPEKNAVHKLDMTDVMNLLVTCAVRYCEQNPGEIFAHYNNMALAIKAGNRMPGEAKLFAFAISPNHIHNQATIETAKRVRYNKVIAVEFTSKLPAPGMGPEHIDKLVVKDITEGFFKLSLGTK